MHPLPRRVTVLTIVWVTIALAICFWVGAAGATVMLDPGMDHY